MQNSNVLPFRVSKRPKACIETFDESIALEGAIPFEGIAPRELVAQFEALIAHYNTISKRTHA